MSAEAHVLEIVLRCKNEQAARLFLAFIAEHLHFYDSALDAAGFWPASKYDAAEAPEPAHVPA